MIDIWFEICKKQKKNKKKSLFKFCSLLGIFWELDSNSGA